MPKTHKPDRPHALLTRAGPAIYPRPLAMSERKVHQGVGGSSRSQVVEVLGTYMALIVVSVTAGCVSVRESQCRSGSLSLM